MKRYFKEFTDENVISAVEELNSYMKENPDYKVTVVQYYVVRYEQMNRDRTYILVEVEDN